MSSGAPWWAFIVTAVVSIGSALFSWLFTHRSASKRDLQNWQRTAITSAVSLLVTDSNKRASMSHRNNSTQDELETMEESIRAHTIQFAIIAPTAIYKTAYRVKEWHRMDRLRIQQLTPVDEKEFQELTRLHNSLIYRAKTYIHPKRILPGIVKSDII